MGKQINFKLLLTSLVLMVALSDGRTILSAHKASRSVSEQKAKAAVAAPASAPHKVVASRAIPSAQKPVPAKAVAAVAVAKDANEEAVKNEAASTGDLSGGFLSLDLMRQYGSQAKSSAAAIIKRLMGSSDAPAKDSLPSLSDDKQLFTAEQVLSMVEKVKPNEAEIAAKLKQLSAGSNGAPAKHIHTAGETDLLSLYEHEVAAAQQGDTASNSSFKGSGRFFNRDDVKEILGTAKDKALEIATKKVFGGGSSSAPSADSGDDAPKPANFTGKGRFFNRDDVKEILGTAKDKALEIATKKVFGGGSSKDAPSKDGDEDADATPPDATNGNGTEFLDQAKEMATNAKDTIMGYVGTLTGSSAAAAQAGEEFEEALLLALEDAPGKDIPDNDPYYRPTIFNDTEKFYNMKELLGFMKEIDNQVRAPKSAAAKLASTLIEMFTHSAGEEAAASGDTPAVVRHARFLPWDTKDVGKAVAKGVKGAIKVGETVSKEGSKFVQGASEAKAAAPAAAVHSVGKAGAAVHKVEAPGAQASQKQARFVKLDPKELGRMMSKAATDGTKLMGNMAKSGTAIADKMQKGGTNIMNGMNKSGDKPAAPATPEVAAGPVSPPAAPETVVASAKNEEQEADVNRDARFVNMDVDKIGKMVSKVAKHGTKLAVTGVNGGADLAEQTMNKGQEFVNGPAQMSDLEALMRLARFVKLDPKVNNFLKGAAIDGTKIIGNMAKSGTELAGQAAQAGTNAVNNANDPQSRPSRFVKGAAEGESASELDLSQFSTNDLLALASIIQAASQTGVKAKYDEDDATVNRQARFVNLKDMNYMMGGKGFADKLAKQGTQLAQQAAQAVGNPAGGAEGQGNSETSQNYIYALVNMIQAAADDMASTSQNPEGANRNTRFVNLDPLGMTKVMGGVANEGKNLLGEFAKQGTQLAQQTAQAGQNVVKNSGAEGQSGAEAPFSQSDLLALVSLIQAAAPQNEAAKGSQVEAATNRKARFVNVGAEGQNADDAQLSQSDLVALANLIQVAAAQNDKESPNGAHEPVLLPMSEFDAYRQARKASDAAATTGEQGSAAKESGDKAEGSGFFGSMMQTISDGMSSLKEQIMGPAEEGKASSMLGSLISFDGPITMDWAVEAPGQNGEQETVNEGNLNFDTQTGQFMGSVDPVGMFNTVKEKLGFGGGEKKEDDKDASAKEAAAKDAPAQDASAAGGATGQSSENAAEGAMSIFKRWIPNPLGLIKGISKAAPATEAAAPVAPAAGQPEAECGADVMCSVSQFLSSMFAGAKSAPAGSRR